MQRRSALLQLAALHPLLSDAVTEFEKGYGSDIPTAALGELGITVVDSLDQLGPSVLQQLFKSVDELLECGDEATETAVATGFLEAVVSRAESSGSYEDVSKHFGPNSHHFVSAWNESLGIVSEDD